MVKYNELTYQTTQHIDSLKGAHNSNNEPQIWLKSLQMVRFRIHELKYFSLQIYKLK